MSIQDKIQRLQTAKSDIANAIAAKGGAVGENDGFEEFSSDIGTISSGITVDESYDISEGKLNTATVTLEGDVTANIPDGVTEIGNRAFLENSLVNKIIIPNTVVSIDDGYSTYETVGAFAKCTNLNEIILPNNSSFVNLPACFVYQCTSLTSIIIPDSITSIGEFAFSYCSSLTSIVIPNGVASIGESAFAKCTSLSNITIPESVTSIGNCAFYECRGLTSITIGDSVTSIGNNAFYHCISLTDIYYTGTQAEWEAITGINDAGFKGTETIYYNYTPAE